MQIRRDGQTKLKHTKRTLNRVRFALEDEQQEFDRVGEYLSEKEKRVWQRMSSSKKHQILQKAKRMTGMDDEFEAEYTDQSDEPVQLTALQPHERVETAQIAKKDELARKYALSVIAREKTAENVSGDGFYSASSDVGNQLAADQNVLAFTQNGDNLIRHSDGILADSAVSESIVAAKIGTKIIRTIDKADAQEIVRNGPENASTGSSEFYGFAKKVTSTAETAVFAGISIASGGAAAPAAKLFAEKNAKNTTANVATKVAKKTASEARKSMGRMGRGDQSENIKSSESFRASTSNKSGLSLLTVAVAAVQNIISVAMTSLTAMATAVIAVLAPILGAIAVISVAISVISSAVMWWQSLTANHDIVLAEYDEYYDGMFNDLGIDTEDVTGEMIADFALTFKDKTILYSQEGRGNPVDYSPKFEFDVISGYRDDGSPIYKYHAGDYYPRSDLNWGADCSGFAAAVYRCFGFSIAGRAPTSVGWRNIGREVQLYEIQPGDVICQTGHVTIYIGDGQQIQMSGWRTNGAKQNAINPSAIITIRRLVN